MALGEPSRRSRLSPQSERNGKQHNRLSVWQKLTTASLATVASLTLLLAGISVNERLETNETVHFMQVMQQHESPASVQDRQHRAFAHFLRADHHDLKELESRDLFDGGGGLEFCEELGRLVENGEIRFSDVRAQYQTELSTFASDALLGAAGRPSFPHCAKLISKLWAPEHWWNHIERRPLTPEEVDREYAKELLDSTPNLRLSAGEDVVQGVEEYVHKAEADKQKDHLLR